MMVVLVVGFVVVGVGVGWFFGFGGLVCVLVGGCVLVLGGGVVVVLCGLVVGVWMGCVLCLWFVADA
ncbi:hypothetical protein, partial [Pseudomonas syringae group genomosp. 7]|uniref:hypothetical protein n=1 Tax=Pseudomonas syringae group genomosp. 7 TaxID=251699 RepID=UPI00376FFEF4